MLLDSGHIQESDVEYLNKQRARKGEPPIEPLYTQADVEGACRSSPASVSTAHDRSPMAWM